MIVRDLKELLRLLSISGDAEVKISIGGTLYPVDPEFTGPAEVDGALVLVLEAHGIDGVEDA